MCTTEERILIMSKWRFGLEICDTSTSSVYSSMIILQLKNHMAMQYRPYEAWRGLNSTPYLYILLSLLENWKTANGKI